MFPSIKTSLRNRALVSELTAKLGLGPENLIARLAFAYSVSQGRKLDIAEIEDSRGKEYSSKVLFGDYSDLYVATICQHYQLSRADRDIPRYVKMHLDDGLHLLEELVRDSPNMLLSDFVVGQVRGGLALLDKEISKS